MAGFGSRSESTRALDAISDAHSNAGFQWERGEDAAGRRVSVFRFRVPRDGPSGGPGKCPYDSSVVFEEPK